VERLRVFFYQKHLLTGREQSTFSVWSSPSWTRRRLLDALTRELRRIAASEYRVEVDSGRVCLSLAGTLHRNMRVWRRSGITAFGQKTPILIAYRRLEGGANPISLSLSPSLPFGVSCLFLSFFMFSCVKDFALTSTDGHKTVISLSTTEDQHLCLSIQILEDSSSGVS
jgi:hypothetical protein